jgi:hypothetical protein
MRGAVALALLIPVASACAQTQFSKVAATKVERLFQVDAQNQLNLLEVRDGDYFRAADGSEFQLMTVMRGAQLSRLATWWDAATMMVYELNYDTKQARVAQRLRPPFPRVIPRPTEAQRASQIGEQTVAGLPAAGIRGYESSRQPVDRIWVNYEYNLILKVEVQTRTRGGHVRTEEELTSVKIGGDAPACAFAIPADFVLDLPPDAPPPRRCPAQP